MRGRTEPGVFYGAMHNFDMQTNEFDYVAGVQVQAGQTAPEGMVSWEIPAQTYAVFETTLPQIGAAFETIYQSWLPASDVERADGPEFELYDAAFNPQDPASKMSIWIPVQEK